MSKTITTITAKELGLHGVKKLLIVVQPNMLIRDALDVMSRNHITSLPIYSHSSTQITSIVNLFDILIHLVKDSKTVEFDEEEFRRLSEPLENVLGLDGDMESYRLHKSYDDDELIDVRRCLENIYCHYLSNLLMCHNFLDTKSFCFGHTPINSYRC